MKRFDQQPTVADMQRWSEQCVCKVCSKQAAKVTVNASGAKEKSLFGLRSRIQADWPL